MTRRQRWLGLAVSGLAIVGAAGWWYFGYATPVGRGPAGPAVPRDAFAAPWTERPVLLLGLGDSVTAGFGASAGKSYFARLAANPPDEFPELRGLSLAAVCPKLTTRNLAISGSESLHHEKVLERLPTYPPETLGLVVFTTGGNDLIHPYGRAPPRECGMYGATYEQAAPWVDAFAARLTHMLDRVDAAFPGGCFVFLGTIYDPTDGVGDIEHAHANLPPWPDGTRLLAAYNDVLRRTAAARRNVVLVDFHADFLGHGIHCTQPWREHYAWRDPF